MSGLEVLGAVAASVQLAGSCYKIATRLLQQRSEAVLTDEIQEDCKTLLTNINEHMLKLSPENRQAAQVLADRLRKIRHQINVRKQKRGFVKMCYIITGQSLSHKEQMLSALQQYQVSAVLTGNEVINQVLFGQNRISAQLDEIAMLLMADLAKLTSYIEINEAAEMRAARNTTAASVDTQQSTSDFSTDELQRVLAKTIREEIAALRSDISDLSSLADRFHIDRSELAADYGTMANYLESIWESSNFTTDQDVWELLL